MERETACGLLSENLKELFAFSFSRLYDKTEAEDLTNEIICEVLKSVHRLEYDEAFYGFLWKIAENTFRRYIRKKQNQSFSENFIGVTWNTPENEYLKKEELNTLRRELSLLTKQYRDVTVAYYFQNKSCSEISADLGISVEMVKYYLFKTRKILKEGLGMTREYGEKSYKPAVFRPDFWGDDNSIYKGVFDRKLPGNIVLAAYEKPVTLAELSTELGVSVPYLEDELDILVSKGIIKKLGSKYQTDIVIFTGEYEKEVTAEFPDIYKPAAEKFAGKLAEMLPELKEIDFKGNDYNDNRLKWTFANIAMIYAMSEGNAERKKCFGDAPLRPDGSTGFLCGYDNDYIYHRFNGIYIKDTNKDETAYFTFINYRVIEKCQLWRPLNWMKEIEAICAAALGKQADPDNDMVPKLIDDRIIESRNGQLNALFPVFTADAIEKLKEKMLPLTDIAKECMLELIGIASETLKKYVPEHLKNKCEEICFVRHHMNTIAFLIETMVENGFLTVPDEKTPIGLYGVTY